MTQIRANGIEIEYETFGSAENPALLMDVEDEEV